MKKHVTFFIIFILFFSSCAFIKADYGGVTLSAWTNNPPVINGVMGLSEWNTADFYNFATDHALPVNGTIYVMNDAENLNIFIIFDYTDGMSHIRIMFDNDNDRVEWEADDDGLYFGWHPPPNAFQDVHFSAWSSDLSQDGSGADSFDGFYRYVEFSHPLNSGDPKDFSLMIGDTVGFQIEISSESVGSGHWPSQAQTTNDIFITGRPIGGELLSLNPLPAYLVITVIGTFLILLQIIKRKPRPT